MDTQNLNLPEGDIAIMRQFYQDELEKTIKRLQHIKNVLDKLGGNTQSVQIQITTADAATTATTATPAAPLQQSQEQPVKRGPGRPRKQPSENGQHVESSGRNKTKRKPGPKSIWEELVTKRLNQINKPLTYTELTEEIMRFAKLPESKRESTKQAIINLVFRLRKRNEKLNTFSNGTKEKYVALKEWFDGNRVKQEYRDKVTPAPTENKKAKLNGTAKTSRGRKKGAGKKSGKRVPAPGKSSWPQLVLDMISSEGKPMLVKTMAERAMHNYNIEPDNYENIRLAVARSMNQLDKKNRVKRHFLNGKRPSFYGLSEWFDEGGELKKPFQQKMEGAAQ